jgi:hypothetical protein
MLWDRFSDLTRFFFSATLPSPVDPWFATGGVLGAEVAKTARGSCCG